MSGLVLECVSQRYSILRLAPRCPLPVWFVQETGFTMLVRTDTETTLLVPEQLVPGGFEGRVEPGWRGMFVRGTLDFGLVGILAGLSGALADEGISLLAVSTFDTDWLFVRAGELELAKRALEARGWGVVDGELGGP